MTRAEVDPRSLDVSSCVCGLSADARARAVLPDREGSLLPFGLHDWQGLSYGHTELLLADMRLLEPDPSSDPPVGLLSPPFLGPV